MKTLKLWRTFKEGMINFRRNGWLTFATTGILTVSLFIVSLSMLIGIATGSVLETMKGRVGVNVSFNPDVSEEQITKLGDLLRSSKTVSSVEYVSRDDALKTFLAGNTDPVIGKAVEQIGENPLLASLTIRAKDTASYPEIVKAIEDSPINADVSRIDYAKNKKIFDRLDSINSITRKAGLVLGGIFIFIAIVITYTTIRITIYSHRQEFEVMRLVGASNLYIQMPFVFEGVAYGLTAALATMVLLFAMARTLATYTQGAFMEGNFFNLFVHYSVFTALGLITLGVTLGVISSFIAIRRYLRI